MMFFQSEMVPFGVLFKSILAAKHLQVLARLIHLYTVLGTLTLQHRSLLPFSCGHVQFCLELFASHAGLPDSLGGRLLRLIILEQVDVVVELLDLDLLVHLCVEMVAYLTVPAKLLLHHGSRPSSKYGRLTEAGSR